MSDAQAMRIRMQNTVRCVKCGSPITKGAPGYIDLDTPDTFYHDACFDGAVKLLPRYIVSAHFYDEIASLHVCAGSEEEALQQFKLSFSKEIHDWNITVWPITEENEQHWKGVGHRYFSHGRCPDQGGRCLA